jgi:adenosylcobinamide-GDP ribazoletransferase
VGAAIGALSGGGAELVARVSHPLGIATAFALSIVLIGAIHVDGFADSCDALFANVTVAHRLEIFKDPRHGTFALAGFVVLSAVWIAALAGIDPLAYPATLALAAAAARWGTVVHMAHAPHARSDDPSPAFVRRPPLVVLLLGLALLVALVLFAAPSRAAGVVEALTCIVVATLAVAWARTRLAGAVVGDVYGFAIVIAEVSGLAASAVAMR